MKEIVPITIDDLAATAKDDKNGRAKYKIRGHWLEVYFDDAVNEMAWAYAKKPISRDEAENWLLNQ